MISDVRPCAKRLKSKSVSKGNIKSKTADFFTASVGEIDALGRLVG